MASDMSRPYPSTVDMPQKRSTSGIEHAILVVDDDADVRDALAELLAGRGFAVTTATDGGDALRLLRSMASPPMVILLDLMMPVMDGYEFLEVCRREPFLASIPVVVITAGYRVDQARLGETTPILSKPIELTRLMSKLHELGAAGNAA
jgi:CheY-like chemotaxis protein